MTGAAMNEPPIRARGPVVRACAGWLDLVAQLVPSAHRRDWRAEWQAEIEAYAVVEALSTRGTRWRGAALAWRCLGAVVHALWLRKEEWSLDMLTQDFRDAARVLLGRPAFTLLAALTLALGIGANTAIFSIVYGVLLKPLPYREPGRLVQLWETNPLRGWTQATIAPANLLDWRQRNRVFDDVAAYMGSDTRDAGLADYTFNRDGDAERLRGLVVSPNFFRVLGVAPVFGRDFAADEDTPGRHRVIVLSDGFWRRRFAGDPAVVGTRFRMGPYEYLVAGVMPRSFRFGPSDVDFWAPMAHRPEDWRELRKPHFLRAVARLREGTSLDQARREMAAIAAALEREHPATNTQMGVGVGPLDDWFVGDVRLALFVFLGAVGCLLLIACANVANLMLVRAVGRAREMAIRTALGAARLRLVRQLLTESLLLSFVGGGVGTAIATWGVRAFVALSPVNVPRLDEIRVDGAALLFTAALTCVTAFLFGAVPALQLSRVHAAEALSATARTGARRGQRARHTLVVAEVGLAFVLLVGAALMIESFLRLRRVDPGFDPSNLLTARIALPAQYDSDDKITQFYERAMARIREIHGVTAAGASTRIALDGYSWTGDLAIQGRPEVWGRELRHKEIVPGYFEAMGLPIVSGRTFTRFDDGKAPPVVVVNRALVREFFGGENPVGRQISFTKPTEPPRWRTIVGVVGDEKQDGLDAPVRAEVYQSHLQSADDRMTIVVRGSLAPSALAPLVREAIRSVDSGIALFDVRLMDDRLGAAVARQRLNVWLFTFFGGAALLLAAIGVAGVAGFAVSSRTREIGVRVAVGARGSQVQRLVLADALRLSAIGVVLGAVGALALGRWVSGLLFETPAADPATLLGVALFLLGTAGAASWIPARRASRVDPLAALRAE
jgi:putative ABC transport system permease protein